MGRPQTAGDAAELVRLSGLVPVPNLTQFLATLSPGLGPDRVLELFVTAGLLTHYQAEELSDGRWRGFWMGSYKILDRLGKGGMGHVFLAEHAILGKRVAVKVLSDALRADPTARRRFVREARAAASIDHPNVVHVFGVDMDHDPPYLVMEVIDGLSLQAAVARSGTFAVEEAAVIGIEVAHGLEAAAAVGLVHRDVKPANLLVDRRGSVKILDLGIVRSSEDDTQPRADAAEMILGTLDYLAPEQALDSAAVDARADLYSLGATLYFLLAGHPPFPGTDLRYKLAAKQHTDPPPIHSLRPDVEPAFSLIVAKLLARNPAERYQNAAELVTALDPFAVRPPDFPGRLFRSERPSTMTDDSPPGAVAPPPTTQRILKPGAKSQQPSDPSLLPAPE